MDNNELVSLITQCALRDQKALQQLYRKTSTYLNAVAFRIVGCHEHSKEVLQDAFLQIWDSAGDYTPNQSQAMTWMTSIVKYRSIDKIRREKHHKNRPVFEEEEEILLNTPCKDEPEEQCIDMMFGEDIEKHLNSMNDNFKNSIQLAYFYGYTREELSVVLNTNLNTVKSWLRRGTVRLKEQLESNYS